MEGNPNRGGVIELLEKLGHSDDAEVLSAARDLHAQISGSGLSWNDLLVPEEEDVPEEEAYDTTDSEEEEAYDTIDSDEEEAYDTTDSEEEETYDSTDSEEGGEVDTAADSLEEVVESDAAAEDLKLIEQLLARKGVSSTLSDELEGYKTDIKEGEFTTADRRYLQALKKRIAAGSKSKLKD